jgi:hypothetical protein
MISTATSTLGTFADFVIGELKCASLRAALLVAEADSIAVALRGGFVSTETAIEWAHDAGIPLVAPSSATAA